MVIADTGFWIALASPKDNYHERANACLHVLNEPLIVTWPVITETCHLLLHRNGYASQRQFVSSYVAGAFEVFNLTPTHTPRLLALMDKYEDLPIDLADASLIILAEFLGHGRILSTDARDFGVYRWKQHEPFENLLTDFD